MNGRVKEAVRYLGYGKHAVDEKTLRLVKESFAELDCIAEQRIVYRIFDVKIEDEKILAAGMEIKSRNLKKNLEGCHKLILLGATLGIRVDRMIKRYSCTEIARAVVMQACAAAMLEEFLDQWQEEMENSWKSEGGYLRPRFSPGYGDFRITHQREILAALECDKKIGLTMTESSMLTPTKSVTALIGIGDVPISCHKKGCESCAKTDCQFRRN